MDLDLPHSDHGPRGGLPILLLHGFPLDHGMWSHQARGLAAAGHRVLVPDLRGFGKAPLGKGPGSMAAYAGDVLRLAARAGLRRFAVAGFSLGGYVALEVARQAGSALAGLALVDARMEADTEEGRQARAALAARVRQDGPQALVDAMLPKLLTPAAPPEMVDAVRATMLRMPVEGATQALGAMASRPDSTPTVRALTVPLLVLVGKQDTLTPVEASRAMAEAQPGAHLVIVPGAHLTPVESPEAVTSAMLEWAARLR